MKSNAKAATEDKLGKLHDTVTDLFQTKLDQMKEALLDPAKAEDLDFIIDTRDLNAAGKWVAYNEITSPRPEEDGQSLISKTLQDVKKKYGNTVIPFREPEASNG